MFGPSLYILYTAQLSHIIAKHELSLHLYEDGWQVYISKTVDDASAAVDQLPTCLVDEEAWLDASHLRLNPAKTQVIVYGLSTTAHQARYGRRARLIIQCTGPPDGS